MEMSLSYPASKFETDNTLTNPVVLEKYQLAADIVNGKLASAVTFMCEIYINPSFSYQQVFFLLLLAKLLPVFPLVISVNLVIISSMLT